MNSTESFDNKNYTFYYCENDFENKVTNLIL